MKVIGVIPARYGSSRFPGKPLQDICGKPMLWWVYHQAIKVEELEAIRLKDIEGLTQEECAKKMEISRQTFQNIIESGRKKIAIALTQGKAIKIAGGHYTTRFCKFRCAKCGYIYTVKYEQDKIICPKCSSTEVMCNKKESFCKKWCCKK